MRSERGFTLVEVLIVLTIVGILLGVAIPRYGSVTGAMKVRSAKQEIASLLSQGRAMAIQTDQTVQVVRTANVISLIAVRESGSTIVAQQDLAFQFGVTVSATKDTVAYDSRGMVTGNNVTLKYVVTNGVARDSVCLLALGKVSPRGCAL
ncbi:MAG: type II secretion system protein [Gemmatimonadaceae bacterium]|nr:type II secretion system protein [Gemmatimonadaceae bacterium]